MSPSSLRHFQARSPRLAVALSAALLAASVPGAAFADAADAHVPPPQDTPYIGTIAIHVDATDTAQGIFRVHETIPVKPGQTLTLLIPKWIPGDHASDPDDIDKFAGLAITANGKPIAWLRDKYDVYAFHVEVPQGVSDLDARFQFLSPRTNNQGAVVMTDRMLDLSWNQVSLYPAGHYSRDITFAPSVTLPAGWKFGSALTVQSQSGNTTTFRPTTYNTLVDSPVFAGAHFRRLDLDPGAKVPVHMDIVADSPRDLDVTPKELTHLRNLVAQAYRLFDSHHFRHFDFLVSLSNYMRDGLEHHQSSENGTRANYFTDQQALWPFAGTLMAHEFTHSWNGKFRRPADLWTPNFNVPMGDSLLWMYEGGTQYWGCVLAARSGMWTPEQYREVLALVAAKYHRDRPGFAWRDLTDTTNDEMIQHRRPQPYMSWQMSEEYYDGGQMMWLAADARIRQLTHDKKSLDTFARDFFGVDDGSFVTKTYTFNDIVAALNGVVKYDWAAFLHRYIHALNPPLLSGLDASGWKLVYNDKRNAFGNLYLQLAHIDEGSAFGIGLVVAGDGNISDVRWNGPAFKAGVGSGDILVAVDGRAYSADALEDAVKAAETSKTPIKLLLKSHGQFRTVSVPYYGGPQYPHLERIKGAPDYLDQIIAAKK